MSFLLRKSIPLPGGFRLNVSLSGRGVSVSIGGRAVSFARKPVERNSREREPEREPEPEVVSYTVDGPAGEPR